MGGYIDLLTSLPKTKRNIQARAEAKDPEVVRIAKQFGAQYFDGDRRFGYGGYYYDGRWESVARDIVRFFKLDPRAKILDVGCAKGFLVLDLCKEKMDAYGLDVSPYAIDRGYSKVKGKLQVGSADNLPFEDDSFDLTVSINTLHNLPRAGVVHALREIERVSRGNSYIVVDSYHTTEEKALFESWALTPEFHDYPEGWLQVFKEAGYTGHYSWNVLS